MKGSVSYYIILFVFTFPFYFMFNKFILLKLPFSLLIVDNTYRIGVTSDNVPT